MQTLVARSFVERVVLSSLAWSLINQSMRFSQLGESTQSIVLEGLITLSHQWETDYKNWVSNMTCRPPKKEIPSPRRSFAAFSLIELLIVISIIAVMAAIAISTGFMKSGGDFTKAAYDISGVIDQARAYAMANNTYVYVGIGEFDAAQSSGKSPQVQGTGRVAIAAIATKDGTCNYPLSGNISSPAWTNYNNGANFVPVGKLLYFDNIHLVDLGTPPATGNMARPAVTSTPLKYSLGSSECLSVTPFDWPLGKALGAGKYSFSKVISFSPQGVARIQTQGNSDDIAKWMEIGLQPTHGSRVPPVPVNQNMGNQAAVQISGITGATRVYRP